jgi:hypothetical protein
METAQAEVSDLRGHLTLRHEERPVELPPDAIAILDAVVENALVSEAVRHKSAKCLRRSYGWKLEEGNGAPTFLSIRFQFSSKCDYCSMIATERNELLGVVSKSPI